MAKLYERTVADLMADAAAELEYPATRSDVVAWFAERYPLVRASTVRAHVVGLTENDNTRHHYASLAKRTPLFVREPDGTLLRYDAQGSAELEADDDEPRAPVSLEFALEAYLEAFLLDNWDGIDWGRPLELWESEKWGYQARSSPRRSAGSTF